eukprot:2910655-Heterocapsa_arctica.AAC.1
MQKLRQLTARFDKRRCRPTQLGSLRGFGYCRRNSVPHPATVGDKSVVQELYKALFRGPVGQRFLSADIDSVQ